MQPDEVLVVFARNFFRGLGSTCLNYRNFPTSLAAPWSLAWRWPWTQSEEATSTSPTSVTSCGGHGFELSLLWWRAIVD